MTKQDLIDKIEQRFGTGTKFFKWLGYKEPRQSWYAFKNNEQVNLAFVKILELLGRWE